MQVIKNWIVESSTVGQMVRINSKFILIENESKLIPKNVLIDIEFSKSEWSTYNLDEIHRNVGNKTISNHVSDLLDNVILAPENITEETEKILNILEENKMINFYGYDAISGIYTGIIEVVYDFLNNLIDLNMAEDSRPEISNITLTIL